MDPNLSCKHTLQTISDICTAQDCDDRLQCTKCVFRHNRFHSSFLIPFKEFSTFSPKAKLEQVMSIMQEQLDYKNVMCGHFAKVLDGLSKNFEELLSTQKQILQPQKLIEDEDVVNLTRVCDELIGLGPQIHKNEKFSLSKLHTYTGKYLEFQRKVSDIEEILNLNPIRSLSYKELQLQIDEFVGLIDQALSRFKDIFFSGSERSNGRQDEILKELAKPNKVHFDSINIGRELTCTLPGSIGWNSIANLEESRLVVIGDSQGMISCWDIDTWKCCETRKYHDSQINSIKYSKKLDVMLTAADDCTIKVLQMREKKLDKEVAILKEHKDKVWSLLVIEDFDIFYSSGKESSIIGWDLNLLKVKHKIDTKGRDMAETEMVFIPSLKLLAVSFKQGVISLYSIETTVEARSIDTDGKWIKSMIYLEEKDQFIVGADVGLLKVWKVGDDHHQSFEELKRVRIPGGSLLSIESLSEESSKVLIGSDCEKIVWLNLETEKYRVSPDLNLKDVIAVKVIPQSQRILVGTWNKEFTVLKYS